MTVEQESIETINLEIVELMKEIEKSEGNEEVSDLTETLNEALDKVIHVTYLDLGYKSIGINAVKALAKVLGANTYLTYLDLSGNQIGDIGADALSEAL